MTITEFLLARIAEDEGAARTATDGPWYVDEVGDIGDKGAVLEVARWRGYLNTVNFGEDRATADHVARHNPARVLAECEAKRDLMVHAGFLDQFDPQFGDFIIRALASVYSDHPDYDEAWRP